MKTKLIGLFGVVLMTVFLLSMVSASTFVTQSTRFNADKSVSELNLWVDNGQGQMSFAYQNSVGRISVQGKVTSYTESGAITSVVLSDAKIIKNNQVTTGLVIVSVNKLTRMASVNVLGNTYVVPLKVYK